MNTIAMRRPTVNRGSFTQARSASSKAKTVFPRFPDVDTAVAVMRPEEPMYCYYPSVLRKNAALFLEQFPGATYYAVKANADPYVLRNLYVAGIRCFDVASLAEVKLIGDLFPDARMAFMHPVKRRDAIRKAYFDYGVKTFVFDSMDELRKIKEETNLGQDLRLIVRVAMPKGSAVVSLAGKFGAVPDEAVLLLKEAKRTAVQVGIAFHVGQQTLKPESYISALKVIGSIVERAGFEPDVLDIGGGFPVEGLGNEVEPLTAYFDAIRKGLAELKLSSSCEIWGEPGRALCGTAAKLVLRVDLRKGDALYVNDGSYGALFDMCWMGLKNDVALVTSTARKPPSANKIPFHFYGPTCASEDHIKGPFMLPDSVAEGDWIVFDSMGGYCSVMQTGFNGFYSNLKVEIREAYSPKILRMRPKERK